MREDMMKAARVVVSVLGAFLAFGVLLGLCAGEWSALAAGMIILFVLGTACGIWWLLKKIWPI